MMLIRVDRILRRVTPLAASVRYHRDVLGLRLLDEQPRVATFALADSAAQLVLHDDDDLPAEAVYWLVDDVRRAYERREALQLRFRTPPTRTRRGWQARCQDPFGNVLMLIDRTNDTASSDDPGATEALHAGTMLFADSDARHAPKPDLLVSLYEQIGRTADDLPYTPHFESLYQPYAESYGGHGPSRREVWRHLLNLRKSGKLPKLGEARCKPPTVSEADRDRLRDLLAEDLGRRDRLPYTDKFEVLVDTYNQTLNRQLSPHLIWRLVATLAK